MGRQVLLLAEVLAGSVAGLAGQPVTDVHRPGTLRAIALWRADSPVADWQPDLGNEVRADDRLVVLATRAGLSGLLRAPAIS